MKLKERRGSGKALNYCFPSIINNYMAFMQKAEDVDLLLVLLINVGTFAQQQLSHLLPLGMG